MREQVAARRAVNELEPLPRPEEMHDVVANYVTPPNCVHPDLAGRPLPGAPAAPVPESFTRDISP